MVGAVDWQLHLEKVQIWQRQAVILQVQATGDKPFARLQSDKWTLPNTKIVPLEFNREKIDNKTDNKIDNKTRLNQSWLLLPYDAGKMSIKLPELRYMGGRTPQKWQPPVKTLNVKPLPPYLPPTIPVGSINIESTIEPQGILKPDHLAYWNIRLSSTQVPNEQFPPLLKQIQSNSQIEVLPAKLKPELTIYPNQAKFSLEYRIPIKPKQSGRLNLPELQWHWFNPKTGKLEEKKYQADSVWVLAIWQRVVLMILGVAVIGFISWKLGRYSFLRVKQKRSYLRVLKLLEQPNVSRSEVREAMRECADIHGWERNVSEKRWFSLVQNQYKVNDERGK